MAAFLCGVQILESHVNFLHAICLPPSFHVQEAAELSSLKSQLLDLEVPLFAVVKENLGKELDNFKKFFSGKVYVDQKVCCCETLALKY